MADRSLADPVNGAEVIDTAEELTPDNFDVDQWLDGLNPARAYYRDLPGITITLQARSIDWLRQFIDKHKISDGQELDEEGERQRDLEFLAAHIESPKQLADPEKLRRLYEKSAPEFQELVILATQLSNQPRSQIQPRFLLNASD